MANYNKIMLMGNLTRDPELSYLPSNTPVCKIGLAVNRRFRRSDGEQGEETLFVDCTAFGRTGEVINQYLRKGRPIFIEGRLKLDRWEDQNGNPRSKHQVVIDTFQFVDSGGGDGGSGGGGGGSDDYASGGSYQSRGNAAGGGSSGGGYNQNRSRPAPANQPPEPSYDDAPPMGDDDIPF